MGTESKNGQKMGPFTTEKSVHGTSGHSLWPGPGEFIRSVSADDPEGGKKFDDLGSES
jgi:hypothetical protein